MNSNKLPHLNFNSRNTMKQLHHAMFLVKPYLHITLGGKHTDKQMDPICDGAVILTSQKHSSTLCYIILILCCKLNLAIFGRSTLDIVHILFHCLYVNPLYIFETMDR